MFEQYVLQDGNFDFSQASGIQEINKNKNIGKLSLTRFSLTSLDGINSYIYKPCEDRHAIDNELFAQERIARHTEFYLPKIYYWHYDPDWMIIEDLGQLKHTFDSRIKQQAARQVARLHSLDLNPPPNEKEYLPPPRELLWKFRQQRDYYRGLLQSYIGDNALTEAFFQRIDELQGSFECEAVLSHGDFHCLNLAEAASGQLILFDWEFLGKHDVYRDLYTLLDMATPRYRIQPSRYAREEALRAYIEERTALGWSCPPDFIENYCIYACTYSLWTYGFFENDRKANTFDPQILELEESELTSIVRDCLSAL